MKCSRFAEEQEAGMPTAEMCCKYGVSSASFYKYKSKDGGMDARKLKNLEEEKLSPEWIEQLVEVAR